MKYKFKITKGYSSVSIPYTLADMSVSSIFPDYVDYISDTSGNASKKTGGVWSTLNGSGVSTLTVATVYNIKSTQNFDLLFDGTERSSSNTYTLSSGINKITSPISYRINQSILFDSTKLSNIKSTNITGPLNSGSINMVVASNGKNYVDPMDSIDFNMSSGETSWTPFSFPRASAPNINTAGVSKNITELKATLVKSTPKYNCTYQFTDVKLNGGGAMSSSSDYLLAIGFKLDGSSVCVGYCDGAPVDGKWTVVVNGWDPKNDIVEGDGLHPGNHIDWVTYESSSSTFYWATRRDSSGYMMEMPLFMNCHEELNRKSFIAVTEQVKGE